MSTPLILASIALMIPNGNRLELPETQLPNYPQVKTTLQKAGGKYKASGFVFSEDASIIQTRLTGGEVINDKKKFQFFPTPLPLAQRLIEMADIQETDYALEPSAGQAAIASLIADTGAFLTVVEVMPQNVKVLREMGFDEALEADFLTLTAKDIGTFDKIIANPPFTNNQDIDHVEHMYSLLDDGGRIVTVMSQSWVTGKQKKQIAFKKWLTDIGAESEELPAGTFKESGTSIASMLITINKPS
jgi:predicted RNA methylase